MFRGGSTGGAITGTTITASTDFRGNVAFAPIMDMGNVASGMVALKRLDTGTNTTFAFGNDGTVPGARISSGGGILWSSSATSITVAADTGITRFSAGVVGVGTGTQGSTAGSLIGTAFYVTAGNGGTLVDIPFNELLTIAAAATTDSATTIPAGAQIVAVSVRVTTVIPTAATFTVTAATGGTTFSTAAVSVAANSTDAGTAAGGATYTAAGTKIRITPNLTPGAATGVVRISGYYRVVTPATT